MKMNKRSDASTSTDDVKDRPLCLFYFTHPFGVLSPEPPTIAVAPPNIARAFVNMEPVSPFTFWGTSTDDSYNTASTESRPSYDLGDATVHRNPVSVVSVARARRCTVDFDRKESLSSSLFSGDIWYTSSSSCRSNDYPRRLVPYNRILPPLRLPSPRNDSNPDSSDDLWPKKCLNPEKFSLPPIEMPAVEASVSGVTRASPAGRAASGVDSVQSWRLRQRLRRRGRALGVHKPRRAARLGDVRRVLATLVRRPLKDVAEGCVDVGTSCENKAWCAECRAAQVTALRARDPRDRDVGHPFTRRRVHPARGAATTAPPPPPPPRRGPACTLYIPSHRTARAPHR